MSNVPGPSTPGLVRGRAGVTLLDQYKDDVAAGLIERDACQEEVAHQLDSLRLALADGAARTQGVLGWLTGSGRKPAPVRGLYIWGDAGRGKTMLMDLFFDGTPVERKSRMHFHAFMASVHAFIHEWRQYRHKSSVKGDDPVAAVADSIAQKSWLLCFDEFSVTDITDAMILGRLFAALFDRGVVIVATSNVRPDLLYQDGLNRALFVPFIQMIEERMQIVHLDARHDFRLQKLREHNVYFVPADASAAAALTAAFQRLTGKPRGAPITLDVLGHAVHVPQACANVARFAFDDLCRLPLGPADFLALARRFHTVVVDAIPVIGADRRDEAKRFITLIDTFYDMHVKLLASADAEPAELYLGTGGFVAFEFKRTVSRLIEMRSMEYLALPQGAVTSVGSGNTSGLVET
ncbi:cell division protein ZapE [Methylocapsa sp. D3K7]|uniref:cell division protein ZapE n=1 Tax=Methylocapsa sp. D3K7 TaxID=3041435 RepID=UPI00244EB355|nr:cell division protein ZapE [Methylocapsa sp. D3K7]WGJ13074.1 cell division protein ZapE [Methylocapsa sp. D3K7]